MAGAKGCNDKKGLCQRDPPLSWEHALCSLWLSAIKHLQLLPQAQRVDY